LVGIGKGRKGGQIEFELQGGVIGLSKAFEGMMMGLVAKFPQYNALNFPQVNRGIELFQIDDITRNGFGLARLLRSSCLRASIAEAFHPVEDKAPSFVAHGGAFHASLTTALSCRFAEQDNGSDDLVIVLEGIDKLQSNLLKILLSRHPRAPFRV
jgi:hypothetical protein